MRTTLVLLLTVSLAVSGQQLPQAGSEQVHVTAIDVIADVRDVNGKVPQNLKPSDFIVREDDVERTVVGVEYLRARGENSKVVGVGEAEAAPAPARRGPWQNVLYFE